ncbi:MAG: leucine-rich repeat domain-containing protein [Holosporales bacterium]|jgi:hypothetical protein|nr:leucine-rich repeat domain-containing protein [Holosporales bacterium]
MKKRKIASALVAFVLGVLSVSSEAMFRQQAESSDDFPRGVFSDDGRLVVSADVPMGRMQQRLVVPSSIGILNEGCLQYCERLLYIAFEADSQLTAIGANVFQGCSSLQVICIPSSVGTLGAGCFEECESLAFVAFEDTSPDDPPLGAVGSRAFAGTSALRHISLPNIENLGPLIFGGSGVLEILIGGARPSLTSGLWAGTRVPQNVEIPCTVTELPIFCFANCPLLAVVTFETGSRLASISEGAFADSALQSICIPPSVERIKSGSFSCCRFLATVAFEAGSRLSAIEGRAFSDTYALRSFVVPGNVESIGNECFLNCLFLATFTFESDSRLALIGERAFAGSALSAIALPPSVAEIGAGCFADCSSLGRVAFEAGSQLRKIKARAFTRSPQAWVVLPNGEEVSAQKFEQGWKRPESPALP